MNVRSPCMWHLWENFTYMELFSLWSTRSFVFLYIFLGTKILITSLLEGKESADLLSTLFTKSAKRKRRCLTAWFIGSKILQQLWDISGDPWVQRKIRFNLENFIIVSLQITHIWKLIMIQYSINTHKIYQGCFCYWEKLNQGYSSVIECLSTMHKTSGSIPSTTTTTKQKERKMESKESYTFIKIHMFYSSKLWHRYVCYICVKKSSTALI
jgi:hypothetical protein